MAQSRSAFGSVILAVVLVILAGSMALRAVNAADSYRPALNVRDTGLASTNPAIGDAPPRLSRRVVVVIIDGLRLRDSYGLAFLDDMRKRGVDAEALSNYPTYSRPNHVAILTGVPPAWSGVRNNSYDWPIELDSLMDRANQADLRSAYAADRAFGAGMMFSADFAAVHYAPWQGGFIKAARLVLEQDYPLVVLLPGRVDAAGHLEGADSDDYRDMAEVVDGELADALSALDLSRDTVIITSDHGHTDEGGHGGVEPEVLSVPLIMAGAGIRSGAAIERASLLDVAPTAAALLGLPAPGHGLGKTLTDVLILPEKTREHIAQVDKTRLLRNKNVVEHLSKSAEPEIFRTRVLRSALVAAVGLLAIGLLWLARRFGTFYVDWRVLVIAVPAFPLTYYALLDILGQSFSLSGIPDRGDALDQLFHFGLVSTAVQVVAGWIALRGRVVLSDRLAAANALTAFGMLIAGLPAALMWALFGPQSFLEPPRSTMMVLVPATYIAVACHALAVAVLLGLEIVVFFARAVDPRVRLRRLERAAERERRRLATERAPGDSIERRSV